MSLQVLCQERSPIANVEASEEDYLSKQLVKKLKTNQGTSISHLSSESDLQSEVTCHTDSCHSTPSETAKYLKTSKTSNNSLSNEGEIDEFSSTADQEEDEPHTLITLQNIISDNKSGIPSISEERAKQERILKMKQRRNEELQKRQNPTKEGSEAQLSKKAIPSKISSSQFSNRQHTRKWTEIETREFYKGLEFFGTDFSCVAQLFPERNRIQVKNKFRKEEKEHLPEIEKSLQHNRVMRMKKITKRLEKAQAQLCNEGMALNQRCQILIQENRKQRFSSIDSVDSVDINICQRVEELQKQQSQSQF